MIEQAVDELTPVIGTRPACRALGVAPATIYRRRNPPLPQPKRPKPPPPRALSGEERKAVLDQATPSRLASAALCVVSTCRTTPPHLMCPAWWNMSRPKGPTV